MNLNFDNNWRRTLLLTKETNHSLDTPVAYVVLDKKKLPCSFKKFCNKYFYDYNFDYDPRTNLIWPLSDSLPIQSLVDSLNRDFPKIASIINKNPSSAHNLSFDDIEDY